MKGGQTDTVWAPWGRRSALVLRPAVLLPALPLPIGLEALPLEEVPCLLLGKAAVGSLFFKSIFKHAMCSLEIRRCLQGSCKLIPAAQGSVLIFPDFP